MMYNYKHPTELTQAKFLIFKQTSFKILQQQTSNIRKKVQIKKNILFDNPSLHKVFIVCKQIVIEAAYSQIHTTHKG